MKFNSLLPEMVVLDIKESLKFYADLLGFKIEYSRDKFVFLSFQGSQIMLSENQDWWTQTKLERPFGRGINFEIKSNNVELMVKKLNEKNYPLFKEIEEN